MRALCREFRTEPGPEGYSLQHALHAYHCGGCEKVSSSRDEIERHQDTRALTGRGGRRGSAYTEIEEVVKPEGEEESVRRAKMWDGPPLRARCSRMWAHVAARP